MSDDNNPAILAARQSEQRLTMVYPKLFETRYKELPDGSMKQEDWVYVGKRGETIPTDTPYRWKDIQRNAAMMAALEPYYKAWKEGQEAPVQGTPLSAWMADAGLVRVLNEVKIVSVEQFAEMADHLIVRLNIPQVREKQKQARAFLAFKSDTGQLTAENAALKTKVEQLEANLAEMKELIEKHAIKQEQQPRPRGRPRKNQIEAIN